MAKQAVDSGMSVPARPKPMAKSIAGRIPFPRNALKEALKISEGIWKENAGDPFDPILLAKSLGTTHRASGFATMLTSSERYGLTKGGPFAKGIELTDLAREIVSPIDDKLVGASLRKALLTPKLFEQIYNKYNRQNIPREENIKASLERQFNVPRQDVDACYKIVMQNVKDYNLTLQSGNSTLLWLDNLGKITSATAVAATEVGAAEPVSGFGEEVPLPEPIAPAAPAAVEQIVKVPRVFISHSKNKKILENMKQTLAFGKFDYRVAEEKETLSMPLSDKVFGLMKECNCAIINVSADQEKKQGEIYSINENVLIEIGASFLHYDRRVLLVIDQRFKDKLPTILQGITAIFYEGQELSLSEGYKLMKVLDEFRNKL